jgi:hypothetical protein
MAYPVPDHEYFKLHLPDLEQVEHIDVKPFDLDELWWKAYGIQKWFQNLLKGFFNILSLSSMVHHILSFS